MCRSITPSTGLSKRPNTTALSQAIKTALSSREIRPPGGNSARSSITLCWSREAPVEALSHAAQSTLIVLHVRRDRQDNHKTACNTKDCIAHCTVLLILFACEVLS